MCKKIIKSLNDNFDYFTLWKYREKDINIINCLSYFIENSINLCKSNYWDKNIDHDLEISITYNSQKNKYLIVDNSGAFNENDLIDVMLCKLNHSSKMYDYSGNIKRGIFWLGKDASIFIKQNNKNEFCGDYLSKNKSEYDLITIEFSESLKNNLLLNSGVAICISECYTQGRTLDESNWNNIKKSLGYKFSYYLSNNKFGTCKIIIYSDLFLNKDLGRNVFSNRIENDEKSIFKLGLDYKNFENNVLENLINNNLQSLKNEKSFYDFKFKILNNQKLTFDDEMKFKDYLLPIKVYILRKPNIHLAGAAISFKNIFVYYPNFLDNNDNGLYIPFNDRMKSGSWRWIRVEINLDNFNIYKNEVKLNSDKNKIIFNANSNLNKDIFNVLLSLWGPIRAARSR